MTVIKTMASKQHVMVALLSQGLITHPKRKLPAGFFKSMPKATHSVVEALLEDRKDHRF